VRKSSERARHWQAGPDLVGRQGALRAPSSHAGQASHAGGSPRATDAGRGERCGESPAPVASAASPEALDVRLGFLEIVTSAHYDRWRVSVSMAGRVVGRTQSLSREQARSVETLLGQTFGDRLMASWVARAEMKPGEA
jgi:hypothetical protein